MKATESLSHLLNMEKSEHTWAGTSLLAIFVLLMGWYFSATYMEQGKTLRIQEKFLTVHDDLVAVHGPPGGHKVAVGKFGLILSTEDDGKTWQRRHSGTTKALSSVSFADRDHGFVVGSGGAVLATKDGGATWVPQKSGTEDQLLGVHAVTPLRVFIVGAFGTLLSTSDGGRSWNKHDVKWDDLIERVIKETGYVEPNLNAIYFNSAENGWIVGEFGLVMHTRDGGSSWVAQRYGSDFPQLYAIEFQDDRNGWAVGQAGSVIQTRDGGQRWSAVDMESKRDLYDLSFDGARGVIVGDGVVLATQGADPRWIAIDAKQIDRWFTGVLLSSRDAIAVGQAGTTKVLSLDNMAADKERATQ
jgi:photosystem II stability/assembly factor-like uncharacterized protein